MERSGPSQGAKPRKELNWWHSFNSWWRDEYDKLGRRPRMHEVDDWYDEHAERIWGSDKPSLEATRDHAKCLRSKKELREYFQRYNANKKQMGRPVTDLRQMRGSKQQQRGSSSQPQISHSPGASDPGGAGGTGTGTGTCAGLSAGWSGYDDFSSGCGGGGGGDTPMAHQATASTPPPGESQRYMESAAEKSHDREFDLDRDHDVDCGPGRERQSSVAGGDFTDATLPVMTAIGLTGASDGDAKLPSCSGRAPVVPQCSDGSDDGGGGAGGGDGDRGDGGGEWVRQPRCQQDVQMCSPSTAARALAHTSGGPASSGALSRADDAAAKAAGDAINRIVATGTAPGVTPAAVHVTSDPNGQQQQQQQRQQQWQSNREATAAATGTSSGVVPAPGTRLGPQQPVAANPQPPAALVMAPNPRIQPQPAAQSYLGCSSNAEGEAADASGGSGGRCAAAVEKTGEEETAAPCGGGGVAAVEPLCFGGRTASFTRWLAGVASKALRHGERELGSPAGSCQEASPERDEGAVQVYDGGGSSAAARAAAAAAAAVLDGKRLEPGALLRAAVRRAGGHALLALQPPLPPLAPPLLQTQVRVDDCGALAGYGGTPVLMSGLKRFAAAEATAVRRASGDQPEGFVTMGGVVYAADGCGAAASPDDGDAGGYGVDDDDGDDARRPGTPYHDEYGQHHLPLHLRGVHSAGRAPEALEASLDRSGSGSGRTGGGGDSSGGLINASGGGTGGSAPMAPDDGVAELPPLGPREPSLSALPHVPLAVLAGAIARGGGGHPAAVIDAGALLPALSCHSSGAFTGCVGEPSGGDRVVYEGSAVSGGSGGGGGGQKRSAASFGLQLAPSLRAAHHVDGEVPDTPSLYRAPKLLRLEQVQQAAAGRMGLPQRLSVASSGATGGSEAGLAGDSAPQQQSGGGSGGRASGAAGPAGPAPCPSAGFGRAPPVPGGLSRPSPPGPPPDPFRLQRSAGRDGLGGYPAGGGGLAMASSLLQARESVGTRGGGVGGGLMAAPSLPPRESVFGGGAGGLAPASSVLHARESVYAGGGGGGLATVPSALQPRESVSTRGGGGGGGMPPPSQLPPRESVGTAFVLPLLPPLQLQGRESLETRLMPPPSGPLPSGPPPERTSRVWPVAAPVGPVSNQQQQYPGVRQTQEPLQLQWQQQQQPLRKTPLQQLHLDAHHEQQQQQQQQRNHSQLQQDQQDSGPPQATAFASGLDAIAAAAALMSGDQAPGTPVPRQPQADTAGRRQAADVAAVSVDGKPAAAAAAPPPATTPGFRVQQSHGVFPEAVSTMASHQAPPVGAAGVGGILGGGGRGGPEPAAARAALGVPVFLQPPAIERVRIRQALSNGGLREAPFQVITVRVTLPAPSLDTLRQAGPPPAQPSS